MDFLFPKFIAPASAQAFHIADQLRAFETLPRSQQRQVQLLGLRALMRHAHAYSPFWRARLEAAGFVPSEMTDMSSFARLPLLTRSELQSGGTAMQARSPTMADSDISTAQTSGSTGRPVAVQRYMPLYGPLYRALGLLENEWHGRDATQPLALIKDQAGNRVLPNWGPLQRDLGQVGPAHCRNLIEHTAEELLPWLQEVKPAYLVSTASMVERLANLALGQQSGPNPPLKQIITFGEAIRPSLRRLVQQAFGAVLVDRYSCEEAGWIAFQCPKHPHYHVSSASVLVEILDEAGNACPPGKRGRVVITALHSFAMPLIRYALGDYASWAAAPETCECGRTLPVIETLWGRERSFLRYPNGDLRLARLTGDHWREAAPINEYRVVQYADGEIEAFVSASRPLTADEIAASTAMLRRVLDIPVPIHVTQCERIDWGGGWKKPDILRLDRLRVTSEVKDSDTE